MSLQLSPAPQDSEPNAHVEAAHSFRTARNTSRVDAKGGDHSSDRMIRFSVGRRFIVASFACGRH